jgi:hypothetical protein
MIWFILAAQFVITAAAGVRWTRVAQQGGYQPGCAVAVKRSSSAQGSPDRVGFLILGVASVVGCVIWLLSIPAALLWLFWPRSVPLRDAATPLVWDSRAVRFMITSTATLFLLMAALMIATIYIGLYFVSLLPLVAIVAVEWALRMSTKAATA